MAEANTSTSSGQRNGFGPRVLLATIEEMRR